MLRPKKNITKKEIKEDPLVTAYVKVQKFLRERSRELNIGFTVLVILIVVGILMVRSKKRAEITAAGRLSIAEQVYHAGEYELAIPELAQVVEAFPGTSAAGKALFFMANAYFTMTDYDNAETYFRRFAEDYKKEALFGASSLAGVAACLESREDYAEAAEWYERAGTTYRQGHDAPDHLKNAGRCYVLAGDVTNGRRVYQIILDEYADSRLSQEVGFILESLSDG